GRYTKPGKATVEVTATVAGKRVTIPLALALPTKSDLEPVAELWARKQISELSASHDGEDAITKLGLKFHLVTDYTSFVAVDRTRVVAPGGAAKMVEQPAAAPAGVNLDSAVGEDTSSAYSGGSSSGGGGGGGWHWGGGGGDGGGFGGGDA